MHTHEHVPVWALVQETVVGRLSEPASRWKTVLSCFSMSGMSGTSLVKMSLAR
jgi:hypothetical protein